MTLFYIFLGFMTGFLSGIGIWSSEKRRTQVFWAVLGIIAYILIMGFAVYIK